MTKEVSVKVKLPHAGKKAGETYSVPSSKKAEALAAIGLVEPATKAVEKSVAKASDKVAAAE